MIDFKEVLSKTKAQLKGMLKSDSSQEDIKTISEIDKQLDSLDEAYQTKEKENLSLKDDLIASVKNTGFKVTNSKEDSGIDQDQKSMDQILAEELEKTIAKQK